MRPKTKREEIQPGRLRVARVPSVAEVARVTRVANVARVVEDGECAKGG